MNSTYNPEKCEKHPSEDLNFVCQEAECGHEFLCSECLLTHHPGHIFISAKYFWEHQIIPKHHFDLTDFKFAEPSVKETSKREWEDKLRREKLLEGCKEAENAVKQWKEKLKEKIVRIVERQATMIIQIIKNRKEEMQEGEFDQRINVKCELVIKNECEGKFKEREGIEGDFKSSQVHEVSSKYQGEFQQKIRGMSGEAPSTRVKSNEELEQELKVIAQNTMVEMSQVINESESKLLHNISKHMLDERRSILNTIKVKPLTTPKIEQMKDSLKTIRTLRKNSQDVSNIHIKNKPCVPPFYLPMSSKKGSPRDTPRDTPLTTPRDNKSRILGSDIPELFPWERCKHMEMKERVKEHRANTKRIKSEVPLQIQIPEDNLGRTDRTTTRSVVSSSLRLSTSGSSKTNNGSNDYPGKPNNLGNISNVPRTPKLLTSGKTSGIRMLSNLTTSYYFNIKQFLRNKKSLTFTKGGDHWESLCLTPKLPDYFRITAKVSRIDAFEGIVFFGIIAGNNLDFSATFKSMVPWDKGQCAYYSNGNISYFDRKIRSIKGNSEFAKGDLISIIYDGSKVVQFEVNGCRQKKGFGRLQGNLHFVAGMNTKGSEIQVMEVLALFP